MYPLNRRKLLQASFPVGLIAAGIIPRVSFASTNSPADNAPGSLVLSGGGKPGNPAVFDAFWKLAGGAKAKIVVVPTAHEHMDSPATVPQRVELVSSPWRTRGVQSLVVRHTMHREEANSADFLAPLQEATGVWFGGGDQHRLLKVYRDTQFHEELKKLLQRGGVVGGSSAGTAVQSELTFVTNAAGEWSLAAGFNLLPNTLLDQHFIARGREERLQIAIERHPHLLGVGIDEFTALVVHRGEWSVVGQSSVTVYQSLGKDEPLVTKVLKTAS